MRAAVWNWKQEAMAHSWTRGQASSRELHTKHVKKIMKPMNYKTKKHEQKGAKSITYREGARKQTRCRCSALRGCRRVGAWLGPDKRFDGSAVANVIILHRLALAAT